MGKISREGVQMTIMISTEIDEFQWPQIQLFILPKERNSS